PRLVRTPLKRGIPLYDDLEPPKPQGECQRDERTEISHRASIASRETDEPSVGHHSPFRRSISISLTIQRLNAAWESSRHKPVVACCINMRSSRTKRSTSCSRKNLSASSGVSTNGSPLSFRLVLSKSGTPVILSNCAIRSYSFALSSRASVCRRAVPSTCA